MPTLSSLFLCPPAAPFTHTCLTAEGVRLERCRPSPTVIMVRTEQTRKQKIIAGSLSTPQGFLLLLTANILVADTEPREAPSPAQRSQRTFPTAVCPFRASTSPTKPSRSFCSLLGPARRSWPHSRDSHPPKPPACRTPLPVVLLKPGLTMRVQLTPKAPAGPPGQPRPGTRGHPAGGARRPTPTHRDPATPACTGERRGCRGHRGAAGDGKGRREDGAGGTKGPAQPVRPGAWGKGESRGAAGGGWSCEGTAGTGRREGGRGHAGGAGERPGPRVGT